jgi:predicted O-methyltransferase YrrM
MPRLKNLLNPKAYFRFIMASLNERRFRVQERRAKLQPNLRGTYMFPPGHFYSPLLDIQLLRPGELGMPHDGAEWWEYVDLRPADQRSFYLEIVERFSKVPFPVEKTDGFRYFTNNNFFPFADAFTLASIIRTELPRRIVEVGSGFSSAVMLDTLDHLGATAELTFIDPFPERLLSLLTTSCKSNTQIVSHPVQEVDLSLFEQLEAKDVLFIDSSHVAKVGSDVAFILLRILPRLKKGVLVHFHDIFYPWTYPADWIREGRAWNESLFLRAFLIGNQQFEVVAFNSYAGFQFPELFQESLPAFINSRGASFWIRKSG